MLRCDRCGQYYIPGFLDCWCRAIARTAGSTRGSQPDMARISVVRPVPGAVSAPTPTLSSDDAIGKRSSFQPAH